MDRTSGFRITGRLIEAARVDASMRGRRFYQLKELPRVGEAALNEAKRDWVTIAVVRTRGAAVLWCGSQNMWI